MRVREPVNLIYAGIAAMSAPATVALRAASVVSTFVATSLISLAQVPATDPAVPLDQQVQLVPALSQQHPRLLVDDTILPILRANALAPGNPFYAQLNAYQMNAPTTTTWLTDDTDAQRQGYWRAPSVAVKYAITGDTTSFNRAKGYLDAFLAQPTWQNGTEDDSGMGAGNIMLGAAITYDMLYEGLAPTYRDQFRAKLLQQARKMYYLGHLQQNEDVHYWQQDPQNNHRYHRDAGLALAVLAVADPNNPDDDWILRKTKDELDFLHQWLPADGSNHEGPGYAIFGTDHLSLAFAAADRTLGTNYLQHDFFKNTTDYRLATLTPGMQSAFAYGDSGTGSLGATNNYFLLAAATHGQADQQAALMQMYQQDPSTMNYGWMSLLWHDPTLTGGSINDLPRKHLFSDIGFATVRDGWQTNDVALAFKTGPYGGLSLNEYRNANAYHYVNIAHDDPDANSFQIFARGKMLAKPDGYSYKKLSSSHNTILVNGAGQRGEGGQWTQPLSSPRDMTTTARLVSFDDRDEITLVEGEAAGAYTGLSRYRRTAMFNEGRYILILDDIRATSASTLITWMVQSDAIDITDGPAGKFALRSDGVSMSFTLAGDIDYTYSVVTSTADNRNTSMGLKQLQASATTSIWRSAALFDAWGIGDLQVTWIPVSDKITRLLITGQGFSDEWLWDSTADTTVLTQVPEPTSLLCLSATAALLLCTRKRFH